MSRIPQSFIDEMLDRVDIVEVVDRHVKLKKTGKNFSACCPFHDEKTPSFTVSQDKQFYYCFGCGATGNALGFIMDFERIGFLDAVDQMAKLTGLEVPREEQSEAVSRQQRLRKRLYELLEDADAYYRRQLREHPGRQKAVDYLKGRGLDGQIARDYGIGYAPPGWDNLLKNLGTGAAERDGLLTGGMLIQPENSDRLYDRFRYRIMFPIRDVRGRVIGFGGRVLGDDKPKYLNSPETPVFHKGRELYGLYEARKAHRELPRLLVVEGYMDVVALAQFGLRYGVATLGTACGEEHLERAFRYTSEVVFCFDGDEAGRRAAGRALENALPTITDGRRVKFLFLPEGEDPDTLIRQIGPEKFEHTIDMAVPLEDQLFDYAAEGLDIRTMEGRAHLSKRVAPLLARLPKGVFRELMFDSLASRTGLNRAKLEELVDTPEPLPATQPVPEPDPRPVPEAEPIPEPPLEAPPEWAEAPPLEDIPAEAYEPAGEHQAAPEPAGTASAYLMPPHRKAMALLLAHPELAELEPDHDFWLSRDESAYRELGRLLKLLHERPHYKIPNILGHWRAAYGDAATESLAAIAGHDLLRAAARLVNEEPGEEGPLYNPRAAMASCLEKTREQLDHNRRQRALARLKSPEAAHMSREEKSALLAEALAGKQPSS